MYKVSSDKKQRALHHGKPNDWVNGQENLDPEEHLQLLKAGLSVLEDRIANATNQSERRELGQEKQKLQREITAFRTANGMLRNRHSTEGINHLFVDIAKAMLPKVQFEIIWNATLREFHRGAGRLNSKDQAAFKAEMESYRQ